MNSNKFILIVMTCLICLASSTALAGPSQAANADFAAIDEFIEKEMRAQRIPGLALGIVQGDQIFHLQALASLTHPGAQ